MKTLKDSRPVSLGRFVRNKFHSGKNHAVKYIGGKPKR